RTRSRHAAEHVGCGVARAEKTDCVGARQRGARCANAARSRAPDALELPDGASFVLVIVSHAVFHGRRQSLSFPEHGCAVSSKWVVVVDRRHGKSEIRKWKLENRTPFV